MFLFSYNNSKIDFTRIKQVFDKHKHKLVSKSILYEHAYYKFLTRFKCLILLITYFEKTFK